MQLKGSPGLVEKPTQVREGTAALTNPSYTIRAKPPISRPFGISSLPMKGTRRRHPSIVLVATTGWDLAFLAHVRRLFVSVE